MRMTNVTLALVVAFLAVLACGGGSVRASLDAPSPDGPTIVGEGQDCQETVSPEFQTICAPGLDCVPVNPGLAGSPGTCQPETAQSPSGPTFVGETYQVQTPVSGRRGPASRRSPRSSARAMSATAACRLNSQQSVLKASRASPPAFQGRPVPARQKRPSASHSTAGLIFSQRASRSSQYSTRSS